LRPVKKSAYLTRITQMTIRITELSVIAWMPYAD